MLENANAQLKVDDYVPYSELTHDAHGAISKIYFRSRATTYSLAFGGVTARWTEDEVGEPIAINCFGGKCYMAVANLYRQGWVIDTFKLSGENWVKVDRSEFPKSCAFNNVFLDIEEKKMLLQALHKGVDEDDHHFLTGYTAILIQALTERSNFVSMKAVKATVVNEFVRKWYSDATKANVAMTCALTDSELLSLKIDRHTINVRFKTAMPWRDIEAAVMTSFEASRVEHSHMPGTDAFEAPSFTATLYSTSDSLGEDEKFTHFIHFRSNVDPERDGTFYSEFKKGYSQFQKAIQGSVVEFTKDFK